MTDTPKAGTQLDALVAERVMGYHWRGWEESGPFTYLLASPDDDLGETSIARRRDGVLEPAEYFGPSYSTNLPAAWEIVEAMERRGWDARIYRGVDGCSAAFTNEHGVDHRASVDPRDGGAPLAICRAALAACTVAADV